MAAYRYNGVRLPALPDWDTGAYPYAAIQYIPYRGGGFISHLRYSDQPFHDRAGLYRYNGALLPAAPEYDRAARPYGLIMRDGSAYSYFAYPIRPFASGGQLCTAQTCQTLFWVLKDGKWAAAGGGTVTPDSGQPLPHWADFNVLRSDGSAAVCAGRAIPAGGITNTAGAVVWTHTCSDSGDLSWGTGYRQVDPALSLAADTVIWANTDISDSTGKPVLAASVPAPVQAVSMPDFCLNSWLAGLAAGMGGTAWNDASAPEAAGQSGSPFSLSPAWMLQGWVMGRKLARMQGLP